MANLYNIPNPATTITTIVAMRDEETAILTNGTTIVATKDV